MTALRSESVAATAGPTATGRQHPSDRVAEYGSPTFERASTFVRARAGDRVGSSTRWPWFLDLRGALALARLALSEPTADVELTDSSAGRRLRAAMAGRTFGVPRNRLCVAVFDVPEHVAARPSGNRQRAMRSALNAAERSGMTVREAPRVTERSTLAAVAARSSPRLSSWASSVTDHDEDSWWVAEDDAGDLAGLAVAVIDARWACLVTLIGFGDSRQSSTARFVLHHAVTRSLADSGVRHMAVLDDSPLLVEAGTRHLQRVLGYRLMRLRPPVPLR